MGVIQRQGFKSTVLNYIGILVGALSLVFVYPQALAEYGLVTLLTELAIILGSVAAWSVPVVLMRFFPHVRNDDTQHYGVLGWSLLASNVMFIGFMMLGAGLYWIIYAIAPALIDNFLAQQLALMHGEEKLALMRGNWQHLLVFAFLISQINVFIYYCTVFQRIVIISLSDLLTKLARPVLMLLYVWKWVSLTVMLQMLSLVYVVCIGLFILYIKRMGCWSVRLQPLPIARPLWKEMFSYSTITSFTTILIFLGLQLDRITVPYFLDMERIGIYGIAQFITNLISIPVASLAAIAMPMVADYFSRNEFDRVQALYQKSSAVLLVLGVYIFVGINLCVDDLFQMTAKYEILQTGLLVVFWLGVGKLVECLGGVSRGIIEVSGAYRWNLLCMGLTVGVNVWASVWLIPLYLFAGIAMASTLALSFYTVLRMGILYRLYGLNPISWRMLGAVVVGGVVYALVWALPMGFAPYWNILFKGGLLTLLYIPLVLWLELSEDLNDMVFKFWRRLRSA